MAKVSMENSFHHLYAESFCSVVDNHIFLEQTEERAKIIPRIKIILIGEIGSREFWKHFRFFLIVLKLKNGRCAVCRIAKR